MRRQSPQARQDTDRSPCTALDLGTRRRVCDDCKLLQVRCKDHMISFRVRIPLTPPQAPEPAPPGLIALSNQEGLVPVRSRIQKRRSEGKRQDLSPAGRPTPRPGPAATCSTAPSPRRAPGPQGLGRPARRLR